MAFPQLLFCCMTDDQLLARPVIVIGSPRSGTTLLSQVLSHHASVWLANEPRILWKYGNDAKSDALQPADARPEVVAHIRAELARNLREAGRTRLVEKTPSNSLRFGFVNQVFPDAIFMHVMRSGLESVLSIRSFWERHSTGVPTKMLWQRLREMKLRQAPHYAMEFGRRVAGKFLPSAAAPAVWGPRPPGIVEMRRDLDLLEVCAWQWRMCVEHTCREGRKLPADRYTEVQLEDFNEQVLSRLMAFAGLAPAEEVLAAFAEKFDDKQPTGRSKQSNLAEQQRVEELVAPTNAWLATLGPVVRH